MGSCKGEPDDALARVNREIDELGGLETYQRMSSIGQGDDRGGGSEKVLIGWLRELGEPRKKGAEKIRYILLLQFFVLMVMF